MVAGPLSAPAAARTMASTSAALSAAAETVPSAYAPSVHVADAGGVVQSCARAAATSARTASRIFQAIFILCGGQALMPVLGRGTGMSACPPRKLDLVRER